MNRLLYIFSLWLTLWMSIVPAQTATVIEVSQTGAIKTISAALVQAKVLNQQNTPVQVLVNPGTYREMISWQNSTQASLEIVAKEPHTVTVSGADVWKFSKQGANYVGVWNNNWGLSPIPPGWTENGLNVEVKDIVRRREIVIVDGTLYQQVLNASELSPGKFYVDETANTITVRALVEPLGVVQVGIRERTTDFYRTNNVTIRGLVFEGAASHFDKDGAYFNESTNLSILNSIFRKNGAGGLGVFRTEILETRNNTFDQNGMSGYTGVYNHDYISKNDTACNNNWRGYSGGFIGWSVAGIKHLHERNSKYTNLTVCQNLAHGLWLDTDMENIVVDGLISQGNVNSGVYVEASQGPVEIRNAVITDNELKGLYISSVHNLSVIDSLIQGNKKEAQIYIGGTNPTRTSWNHVTGLNYQTYPAKNIVFQNVNVMGLSENIPAFRYVTGQFNEQFKPTYIGVNNVWRNLNNSRPFQVGSSWYTTAEWSALTGQDLPQTPTPTPTKNPTATTPFTPTLTPSLTPTLTPTVTKRYRITLNGEIIIEVEEID